MIWWKQAKGEESQIMGTIGSTARNVQPSFELPRVQYETQIYYAQ